MKISIEDARHIAKLSRLDFSETDIGLIRGQLDAILHFISKLNELDTTGIEPTSHIINMANVAREDVEAPPLRIEDTMRNAPDPQGPFFRVPKIIE